MRAIAARSSAGRVDYNQSLQCRRTGYRQLLDVHQQLCFCTGHHENGRDVLRLSNDLSELQSQQGYLQCSSVGIPTFSPFEGGPQGLPPPPAGLLTHFFMHVRSCAGALGEYSTTTQFEQVLSPCLQSPAVAVAEACCGRLVGARVVVAR